MWFLMRGVLLWGLLGCLPALAQSQDEQHLLLIRGPGLVAGVLPDAGGRLVLLRAPGAKNWLDSNTGEWPGPHPEPRVDAPFSYSLFGVTVWLGPQSAFWSEQDLDPKRRAEKAKWPPDPFGEWGRATVVERREDQVVLSLPPSPLSGIQLTKDYRISQGTRLTLTITATNRRSYPVRRDIWPDIHVDPAATIHVLLGSANKPGLPAPAAASQRDVPSVNALIMKHTVLSGREPDGVIQSHHDRLIVPRIAVGPQEWSSKTFVYAPLQHVVCLRQGEQLLIQGPLEEMQSVHSEHAPVELYFLGGQRPRLEVEMHGACRMLNPGESMRFVLTFEVGAISLKP